MKNKTECDHDCDRVQWIYREYDDSMWNVTVCSNCEGAIVNELNTDLEHKDYAPGFNRETNN